MNKIILIKNINSIFIIIILITGTISQSSFSFMTTASAQTESYVKDVSDSSLNCNNINVNVNGLEFEVLPPALSALLTGGEADASAYGSGTGNYGSASSSSESDFRFICINNNNNTIVEEPIQPEPTTGTLKVSKELTCGPFPLAPPEGAPPPALCEELLAMITEDQFLFQVEGINPDPSSPFLGSPIGTDVRLDAGNYVVNEIVTESVIEDAETFQANHPEVVGFGNQVTFIGDCNNLIGSYEATGTISAGESQTCNVINQYFLTILPEPTTATLTVKKQVFGCDDFDLLPGILAMNCQDLQNTSTG
jgi:hypothetical protein